MLRTAMLSTRADRNYGPPDGIQPEFDLLSRRKPLSRSRRKLYRSLLPAAKVELRHCRRQCSGTRTIHHNSSSRKTSVTLFYEHDFKIYGQANRVPASRSIAHGKTRAARLHNSLTCELRRSILPPIGELGTRTRLVRPPSGPAIFSTFVSADSNALHPTAHAFDTRPRRGNRRSNCSARHAADEVEKIDVTPAKPNRPISLRDRLVVGLAGPAQIRSRICRRGRDRSSSRPHPATAGRRNFLLGPPTRGDRSRRPTPIGRSSTSSRPCELRAKLLHVSL